MREIKFRAWDVRNRIMITEDEEVLLGFRYINGKQYVFRQDGLMASPHWAESENRFKIMQYTGLKDKKGKEIYEGDIIAVLDGKFDPPKNRVSVEWNNASSGFDPFIDHEQFITSPFSGEGCDPENCEVIGNIYENPQLLEET